MSLTKVSFSMISGSEINVFDFGAKGDGVTDDTVAIQNCIDHVASLQSRPTIVFPAGVYKTTSTINITVDSISVLGLGVPSSGAGSDSGATTRGPCLRYYGTGIGLQVGNPSATTGLGIYNIRIENLRIETDNNATMGLKIWQPSQSYFKKISIFGMRDAGIGLGVYGSLDTLFEQIDVTGFGQTHGTVYTDYAARGLDAGLGYLNMPSTTTVFRKCYFHYCNIGAYIISYFDFEDCTFESTRIAVSGNGQRSTFTRCWWEANTEYPIEITANSAIALVNSHLDIINQQAFVTGSSANRLNITDSTLASANSSPQLFATGVSPLTSNGLATIQGCILPANFTIGGVNTVNCTYVKNTDMNVVTYQFRVTTPSIGDNTPTINNIGFIKAAQNGHILSVNSYQSGAITSGRYYVNVIKNSTNVTNFSYPYIDWQTGNFQYNQPFYSAKFNADDTLSVNVHLDTGTTTGLTYVVEVVVAYGNDAIV